MSQIVKSKVAGTTMKCQHLLKNSQNTNFYKLKIKQGN